MPGHMASYFRTKQRIETLFEQGAALDNLLPGILHQNLKYHLFSWSFMATIISTNQIH